MARTVSTSHLPKEPRERCALHTPCTLATCQLPKVLQERCACFTHLGATTACTFSTSQLPKGLRRWGAFNIMTLTWKCASRHNGAHCVNISSSKRAPRTVCFAHAVHFCNMSTSKSPPRTLCLLHASLAPQRHALFRHLNFQKGSDAEVFLTCWLRNMLRATASCNCLSLIRPKGFAPATLASPLFDPPGPQNIGKKTVFRVFSTFSRTCIFFLLTRSLLWSSFLFFSLLSLFPPLLFIAFPSVHIVGSFTSKLSSMIRGSTHFDKSLSNSAGTVDAKCWNSFSGFCAGLSGLCYRSFCQSLPRSQNISPPVDDRKSLSFLTATHSS